MTRTIPVIRIGQILLVSIQIELSDALVVELKENVTREIYDRAARGLVIEVSGIDVLDSYIARSLRDMAHIAKLMGVRTVLAGLDPAMAVTLVEMGMLLPGLETALNLETALRSLAGSPSASPDDDTSTPTPAEDDEWLAGILALEVDHELR